MTIKGPIDWTETLNEAAIWHDYQEFVAWFASTAPGVSTPDQFEYEEFCKDLDFMRGQAACLYFGRAPDLEAINRRLQKVSLAVDCQAVKGTRLPALLAREDGLLRRIYGALFVEFAAFVASRLASGEAGLSRCQGLYRDERARGEDIDAFERIYRSEIPLLKDNDLVGDPAIQRCFDFFIERPKARFCSDTCRFNTFQITKQYNDPSYLAEKQRRYRKKLQS